MLTDESTSDDNKPDGPRGREVLQQAAPAALDVESPSRIVLPPVPADQRALAVAGWSEPLVIDTYLPLDPAPYPAFLDTRVYQGSSGRVYPLPFHERIGGEKRPHVWQAIHLENDWVRLAVLPELGGRIHVGYDKVADYDFFYRNNVIKPALVGLAGPWISGGVEFNWPQHHRPATFLPTDWTIERETDGSVTVWCSDHDPQRRMKGMHGIRLRPGSSVVEARVRLHNRTDETQTFLWWANVAAAVGDEYQSFFPLDVRHVADHAKRAVATFPKVQGRYYGVDYPAQVSDERPDADRLDWYRNIPVPTSYMVTATREAFFGGYDHNRRAGFVHWADPAISPGKKQWTWGDAPFGRAWGDHLTDGDGPYVELMAGVYTDNQPDFSWIAPGETKTFSQYWYPIRAIGPAHMANLDVAVRVDVVPGPGARAAESADVLVGVAATRTLTEAVVELSDSRGALITRWTPDLAPSTTFEGRASVDMAQVGELRLRVLSEGTEVLTWAAGGSDDAAPAPEPATEPADPALLATVEELFLTGQYLAQHRHATRSPEPYWREALRRDPGDTRSNVALASRLDAAGRSHEAEELLRRAVDRLVGRAPNPADGTAHHALGLCLLRQGRDHEADEAFAKAAWNAAWRVPAGWQRARIAARRGDLRSVEHHLRALRDLDVDHLGAGCLLATVLRQTGREVEATHLLTRQLQRDPLDQWTRLLGGASLTADAPTLLDVALDLAACGLDSDALPVLDLAERAARHTALGQVQVGPLVEYHRAFLLDRLGRAAEAAAARRAARAADTRHCLASRLADVDALRAALSHDSDDPLASLLLGAWLYDRERHTEAAAAWERTVAADPTSKLAVIALRNLGICAFNIVRDPSTALRHFEAARDLAPRDARLLYEHDQLLQRRGTSDAIRLQQLEQAPGLVAQRDDLVVELATLLTRTGRCDEAAAHLRSRGFQPWEGGEGKVVAAWEAAMIALAHEDLAGSRFVDAVGWLEEALAPPANLGEARHHLANLAEVHWHLGVAQLASGDEVRAAAAWETAAGFSGDFSDMSTQPFSRQTVWSVRAMRALGRPAMAADLESRLRGWVEQLSVTPARIDFFATSLPSMLVFHDDPQVSRDELVAILRAQLDELVAYPGQPDRSPTLDTSHRTDAEGEQHSNRKKERT